MKIRQYFVLGRKLTTEQSINPKVYAIPFARLQQFYRQIQILISREEGNNQIDRHTRHIDEQKPMSCSLILHWLIILEEWQDLNYAVCANLPKRRAAYTVSVRSREDFVICCSFCIRCYHFYLVDPKQDSKIIYHHISTLIQHNHLKVTWWLWFFTRSCSRMQKC